MLTPDDMPCWQCQHACAARARKQILDMIIEIRRGERASALDPIEDLPPSCCRRAGLATGPQAA